MKLSRRLLGRVAAGQTLAALSTPAGSVTGQHSEVSADFRYESVRDRIDLQFPRDHGAHTGYRTEWWYLTGWLDRDRAPIGLQITFFRSRTRHPDANPSRFAPRQLLFAHVALADPQAERLLHEQRAARAGAGNDQVGEGDLAVSIGNWTFARLPDDRYLARIFTDKFRLELETQPDAPLWKQGDGGYSRKGPRPEQASYYYSRPQLRAQARLSRRGPAGFGQPRTLECLAWLDHEWSSELLDDRAVGWDWVGLNLDDGGAIMAFRIRPAPAADGRLDPIWQDGSLRRSDGQVVPLGEKIRFEPTRWWRSPRTGVEYPIEMTLLVANRQLRLRPLLDDQELDSRMSTGALYWEGAVRVFEGAKQTGVGYLELTGYGQRLRL